MCCQTLHRCESILHSKVSQSVMMRFDWWLVIGDGGSLGIIQKMFRIIATPEVVD